MGRVAFGLPGLGSTSLGRFEGPIRRALAFAFEPYHFPDGNASVARLLVRHLIPRVADGSGMEEVLTTAFDYSLLYRADAEVRLRLGSIAIANSDAGASAHLDVAIDQAWRAVGELS